MSIKKKRSVTESLARSLTHLYGNDIWVEPRDELGELRPVVLDAKKEAIGIPSHELQGLSLGLLRRRFFAGVVLRRRESGSLGGPVFLDGFEVAFHRRPRGSELGDFSQ